MFRVLRSIALLSIGAGIILLSIRVSAATKTAALSLTPASGTVAQNADLVVTIQLNTGGQGSGGFDITLNYANMTYKSFTADTNTFPVEVSPVSNSGTAVRIRRVTFADGGFSGQGNIGTITFTAVTCAASLTFANTSSVYAYTDSSNILNTTSNGTYTGASGSGEPTPAPTSSPEPTPTPPAATPTPKATKPSAGGSTATPSVETTATPQASPTVAASSSPEPQASTNPSPIVSTTTTDSKSNRTVGLAIGALFILFGLLGLVTALRHRKAT